ncbi:MAG: STAS domain-containing protein [Planctomycetota bacterium]
MLKIDFVDRPFPGGTAVFGKIAGSIDANTLPEFRKQIQAFLEKGRKFIVLLSQDLKYVNSSGLGALIKMATELHQEGGRFSMVKVPEKILALFKMLGILDVVSVFDSEKEAFQALGELVKPPPHPHFPGISPPHPVHRLPTEDRTSRRRLFSVPPLRRLLLREIRRQGQGISDRSAPVDRTPPTLPSRFLPHHP